MKTAQAATQLCAAYLTQRNPGDMAADYKLLLLSAITAGIGEYYSLVPARYREKQWGTRFAAPVSGTITATTGSRDVTVTGVFPVNGCSVLIAGDAVLNRLLATESGGWELMVPYGGSTGSGKALTVYRDVAVLPWTFSRFISGLKHAVTHQELVPRPVEAEYDLSVAEWPYGFRVEQTSQGEILRLLPLPGEDVPVSGVMELTGVAMSGIAELTNPAANAWPMSDDHATRFVLPLVAARLVGHPLWKDPGMARVAETKAAQARADIRLLKPTAHSGWNRINSGM